MSRLLRLLLGAAVVVVSILPAAARADQGRVPINNRSGSFDGYYGYDGKYHRPTDRARPASPFGVRLRMSGRSTLGFGNQNPTR
jgi:hypothetical protein